MHKIFTLRYQIESTTRYNLRTWLCCSYPFYAINRFSIFQFDLPQLLHKNLIVEQILCIFFLFFFCIHSVIPECIKRKFIFREQQQKVCRMCKYLKYYDTIVYNNMDSFLLIWSIFTVKWIVNYKVKYE